MKKLMTLIKRHRILTSLVTLVLLIVLAYIFLEPYAAISFPSDIGEACGSIVFDKKEMNAVNRVVIQTGTKKTEITDQELIKMIVNETMTAESVGYNTYYRDNYIRLYHGDNLVREMRQGAAGYELVVDVYQTDSKHINFLGAKSDIGVTILSQDLLDRIYEALEADGNYYSPRQ